ncbi:hypothetical protein J6590_012997 [Homalodisca vitripennis]|nr:hypothetical protein J6590_012997 [Homalodisca vitripennis]
MTTTRGGVLKLVSRLGRGSRTTLPPPAHCRAAQYNYNLDFGKVRHDLELDTSLE